MPWEDILKILSLALGIIVIVFAAAKYKINQDQKVKELDQRVKELEKENDQKVKEF